MFVIFFVCLFVFDFCFFLIGFGFLDKGVFGARGGRGEDDDWLMIRDGFFEGKWRWFSFSRLICSCFLTIGQLELEYGHVPCD